ncbi:MAG TPA: hypothetical protein VEI53_02295, partial [Ktedonobacteraceae bacterium]|nr:hypothetical protein [Ktedonobacteraceae bacterium]
MGYEVIYPAFLLNWRVDGFSYFRSTADLNTVADFTRRAYHDIIRVEYGLQEEISMARDTTNMPFERSTSYQNDDSSEQANDSKQAYDTSLKIENMLLEEFNYASVTAYQAMEDRARISSFYYILLGVLASGLAAVYQLSGGTHNVPQGLIAMLLLIGGLISICFFVTIIRLRQAYKESLLAMNVIKEFYIDQFKQQMPAIEQAFRWRLMTMPEG